MTALGLDGEGNRQRLQHHLRDRINMLSMFRVLTDVYSLHRHWYTQTTVDYDLAATIGAASSSVIPRPFTIDIQYRMSFKLNSKC